MTDKTENSPPLIEIPFVDASVGGSLTLTQAEASRFNAIMTAGRQHYGTAVISVGDVVSRSWLSRQKSPMCAEIDAIANEAGRNGAWLLNLSYEWSCTTGTGPDPSGAGNRMLRTLDWPLDGLGETIVVAKFKSAVGEYFNITWPGFVGVATAMAPGRFSAAINQPPFRKWTKSCWFDWIINRGRLLSRKAIPPTHLLRQVFDTCATYDEAKQMLCETSLAIPAFFTLSGTAPDQSCLIEREEDSFSIHESPTACANHWIAKEVPGHYRGIDSPGRLSLMNETRDSADDGFGWVKDPILNETTRVAVVANAHKGKLMVRGYERDGVVTSDFHFPPSA